MPVTIHEVAEKARVGIGTVSRVLDHSTLNSLKTRARVLQVIKTLNYQLHAMAHGLARPQALTIAALVPFFTGHCYLKLLKSIQQILSQFKYTVALCGVDDLQNKAVHFEKDHSDSMNSSGDGGRRCMHC